MKLQWKVALVVIMAVILTGTGLVRFALAVGSDLKDAVSEIQAAQSSLQQATGDWQTMMSRVQKMRNNSKEDLRDVGAVIELQATVEKDLMGAEQHCLAAVEVLEKHFNR